MGTVWSDFFAGRNPLPPLVCVAEVQNENEAVLQKQKRTKALGCFKLVKFLKFLMVYQSDVIVKFCTGNHLDPNHTIFEHLANSILYP